MCVTLSDSDSRVTRKKRRIARRRTARIPSRTAHGWTKRSLKEGSQAAVRRYHQQYIARQKRFWDSDSIEEAKFQRVNTSSNNEEEFVRQAKERAEFIFQDISLHPDATILELGCGVGAVIAQVRSRGVRFGRFIGVDISERMIEYARQSVGNDPRIELLCNNGADLQMIADRTVDFAYSVDVFIHIFDPGIALNYLKEVERTLKPRGLFRFNVRYLALKRSFADTLGGRFARWKYLVGISSTLSEYWTPKKGAEFNGLKYMLRDLEVLIYKTGLQIQEVNVVGEHLYATVRKPPLLSDEKNS